MKAFLLAWALAGGSPDPERLLPDTVLTPPGGPVIVFVEAPGSRAAAIRATVSFSEAPAEAGAGYLLQQLALRRTGPLAENVGAGMTASRTSKGLVYRVNGSVSDFDHLAGVVRELLNRPQSRGFVALRTRLQEMSRERQETPRGALRIRLRERSAPASASLIGTPSSLQPLTPGRLLELWGRSHLRERISLVVVGDLPPEAVLSSFADILAGGEAPDTALSPPEEGAGANRTVAPERLRIWYGEAFAAGDTDDPRSEVLMRIARQRLPARGSGIAFDLELERWEMGGRAWLTMTGGALRQNAPRMRVLIRDFRADVAESLTPAVVQRARAEVHTTLVSEARSPGGLAEVIGRHWDATGDPGAASDYLERLEGIDYEAMASFMAEVEAGEAVTEQLGG